MSQDNTYSRDFDMQKPVLINQLEAGQTNTKSQQSTTSHVKSQHTDNTYEQFNNLSNYELFCGGKDPPLF